MLRVAASLSVTLAASLVACVSADSTVDNRDARSKADADTGQAGQGDTLPLPTSCADRTASQCRGACVPILGTSVDARGNAVAGFIGCRDDADLCDAAKLCGDLHGTCYFVTSTCVPPGFAQRACGGACPTSQATTPPDHMAQIDPPASLTCADILQKRPKGMLAACGDGCESARALPDLVVSYTLALSELGRTSGGSTYRYTGDQRKQAFNCLASLLRADGISAFDLGSEWSVLAGTASLNQILPHLTHWLVALVHFRFEGCPPLSVAACAENPFCVPIVALALDPMNKCWIAPAVPVGCLGGQTSCGAAFTSARDAGGACWYFSSTCLPPGYTEDWNTCGNGVPTCP